MKPQHLYIIGNGFDIHHGIQSSYRAYREWLLENHPELLTRLEIAFGFSGDAEDQNQHPYFIKWWGISKTH